MTAPPGATLHLSGELGLAKPALIQAIAGLWPWGRGTVALPEGALVTVVPHKLHLSEGRLRDVFESASVLEGDAIAAALRRYGLSGLAARIDEVRDWDKELATGDRQRLALARAELEAPDIVLLDEATSALDTETALELIEMLRAARPDAIILGFGQSAGFAEAATQRVMLKRAGGVVRLAPQERQRQEARLDLVEPGTAP